MLLFLTTAPFFLRSRRQVIVALSTMEAEYMAVTEAAKLQERAKVDAAIPV